MREYIGALHVHSCYSDGSGTVREITAAARRAGLDFLVLADHDTLRAKADGWQGWHDDVLVIVAVEISCQRSCHVVAFGARDVVDLMWKPVRRVLFDLKSQGAAAFVAHAQPAHILGYPLKAVQLHEWEIPGFTGVELWSFMHDICSGLTPWRIPSFLYTWRRRIRGPDADVLAHWDRITQTCRFVAVGSLDNHAIAVPVIGTRILPYEEGFKTLRTHVFCEDLEGEAALAVKPNGRADAGRLIEALCKGRAFIALDMLADARGFRFEAVQGDAVLHMGEEHRWRGPVVFRADSPVEAGLVLLRNGVVAAQADGTDLEFRATEPGVYRVEAHRRGRPWVYTNPIYLRPSEHGWKDDAG